MTDIMRLEKTHVANNLSTLGQWVDDCVQAAKAKGWILDRVSLDNSVENVGYRGSADPIRQYIAYTATIHFYKSVPA